MLYHPLVGTIHGIETIKGVIKVKKQITPKILTLIQTKSLPKGKGFFLSW